jgi:hypothetical protein
MYPLQFYPQSLLPGKAGELFALIALQVSEIAFHLHPTEDRNALISLLLG